VAGSDKSAEKVSSVDFRFSAGLAWPGLTYSPGSQRFLQLLDDQRCRVVG
jgi:hypothetical protein